MRKSKIVSLDQLVSEKLDSVVTKAIEELKISRADGLHIDWVKGKIFLRINWEFSASRLFAWLSGFLAALILALKLIEHAIDLLIRNIS